MGKRKSSAKPPPKKRNDKLDTIFSCPFCSHGTSVECRIDMKNLIGEASCRICQESFSTTITDLCKTQSLDLKLISPFVRDLACHFRPNPLIFVFG
ncbi:hypothetical protein EV1_004869 [Malus domestica]